MFVAMVTTGYAGDAGDADNDIKERLSKLFFSQLNSYECNAYIMYIKQRYQIKTDLPLLPDSVFNDMLSRLMSDRHYLAFERETNQTKVNWDAMSDSLKQKTYDALLKKYADQHQLFLKTLDSKLRDDNLEERQALTSMLSVAGSDDGDNDDGYNDRYKDVLSKLFFSQLNSYECNAYLFYIRQLYKIAELPVLPDSVFNAMLNRLLPNRQYKAFVRETNRTKVNWNRMSHTLKYKTFEVLISKYAKRLEGFIMKLDSKLRDANIPKPYDKV